MEVKTLSLTSFFSLTDHRSSVPRWLWWLLLEECNLLILNPFEGGMNKKSPAEEQNHQWGYPDFFLRIVTSGFQEQSHTDTTCWHTRLSVTMFLFMRCPPLLWQADREHWATRGGYESECPKTEHWRKAAVRRVSSPAASSLEPPPPDRTEPNRSSDVSSDSLFDPTTMCQNKSSNGWNE